MNESEKRFILENFRSRSPRQIARELGIKERKVVKFIEEHKGDEAHPEVVEVKDEEAAKPAGIVSTIIEVALIVLLGIIVYSGSLSGSLLWDDNILITSNNFIKDTRNIPAMFTKPITYMTDDVSNFYRPLQMFTYALNYRWAGLDPRIYHATNLFFHIMAAVFIYFLIRLVIKNGVASLIASLLFVSHPIQTEAVSYVSGRADPMVLMYMAFSAVMYILAARRGKSGWIFLILAIVSFAKALLCKEIALVLPLILIAYDLIYGRRFSLKALYFLGISLFYIYLRKTSLNFPAPNITEMTTLGQRLPVIFHSLALYIRKLVVPSDLHMEYPLAIPASGDPLVIFGILFALAAAALAIFKRNSKAVLLGIAWFAITYAPLSNIMPLNAFFSEHWIYIPSVGICMLIGYFASKAIGKGKIAATATIALSSALIFFYSAGTIKQNAYWKDPESFYRNTIKYNPASARLYFQLALYYFQGGQIDKGIEESLTAIKIDPKYSAAYENLAAGYLLKNEADKALEAAEKAVSLKPDSYMAHFNLGSAYARKGLLDKAIEETQKSLSLRPDFEMARKNLEQLNSYKK